jgi:hypothetical protein
MKTFYLFIILFTSLSIAQGTRSGGITNQAILPQGIRWQALSSNGFSYNFPTALSQIGGSNPAALSGFDTLAWGLSYQFDSDLEEAYFAKIGYRDNYLFMPQSIALAYPYNDLFTFGISAAQKYNGGVDLGKLPITTVTNPEGTGEFFSPDIRTNIFSLSGIIAIDLEKSLPGLNLALRYNYDRFFYDNKIGKFESKASGSSSSFAAGFAYKINIYSGLLEFSGFYEQGADISAIIKTNNSPRLAVDSLRGSTTIGNPSTNFETKAILPNRWHVGLKASPGVGQFMFEYSSINWEGTGNFRESTEISASYTHRFSDRLSLSLGVYSTDKKLSPELPKSWNKFTATFITLGVRTKFNGFDVDLALADSHLSGNKWREQTIFKIAVGTSL